MASSHSSGAVAGDRSIIPPFLLGLHVLGSVILATLFGAAPPRTLEDLLPWLVVAVAVLGWGGVLAWAASHRVWVTPTHLVVKSFGRVEAVRWQHVRSVTHMYRPRLPAWLLIRTGYGCGGRLFRVEHELFRNRDHLHAAVTARAREANPGTMIQAHGTTLAYEARRESWTRPPPPELERFEPRGMARAASASLTLSWHARLLAMVSVALASLGLAHAGLSVTRWLASGDGPGVGGFALFVAELGIGPVMGVVGLYVLASAVRVTPAGVTVRAWGAGERTVAWDGVRYPSWAGMRRGLWLLSPRGEFDGGALEGLFDRRAVVVSLGSYSNEGLLFDPPGAGTAFRDIQCGEPSPAG